MKYTNLHTNPVFGGRGEAPVNRGHGISGPGKSGIYCIIVSVIEINYGNSMHCTTDKIAITDKIKFSLEFT